MILKHLLLSKHLHALIYFSKSLSNSIIRDDKVGREREKLSTTNEIISNELLFITGENSVLKCAMDWHSLMDYSDKCFN